MKKPKVFSEDKVSALRAEIQAVVRSGDLVLRIDYPERDATIFVVGDAEMVSHAAQQLTVNGQDCKQYIEAKGQLPKQVLAGMRKRHRDLTKGREQARARSEEVGLCI